MHPTSETMKDFIDRDLSVGDYVAYTPPYHSRNYLGVVIGFTAKQVRVRFVGGPQAKQDDCIRSPRDLVKVDGPELSLYVLKHSK